MPKKNNLRIRKGSMKDLRNTRESQDLLAELGSEVKQVASERGRVDGYVVTDLVLESPRNATSVMATGHAARHNRKTHALIKALGDVAR